MTNERKVIFTTQGHRNHEPVNEPREETPKTIGKYISDRKSWGSLEQDKWEVLFSVYGRNNVRFGT
jgi:hypothetical protein